MKIGFYNPYFDSYGGGERYVLTLASYWSKRHDVHIFWDDKEMLSKAEERFGLDVSKLTCIPNVFAKKNILEKLLVSASYDLMFFLSDGSIPTSLGKRNILHFQVPFSDIRMNSWKARRYNMIVCNSEFTRKHIHCPYDIPMTVIYPPVDTDAFLPAKKTKTILTVGRFNALYEAKKQEILLNAFITLSQKNEAKGWRFILAGSALPSDKEYVNRLQKLAKNYPVDFFVNQPLAVLQRLYSAASLYWHGAG